MENYVLVRFFFFFFRRELYLILKSGEGSEGRPASLGDGVRVHALAAAAEHDVRDLLGLLDAQNILLFHISIICSNLKITQGKDSSLRRILM